MSKVSCLTLHVYCENSVFLMAWEGVEDFYFGRGDHIVFQEGGERISRRLQNARGEGGRGYRKLTANEVRSLEYFKALRGVR